MTKAERLRMIFQTLRDLPAAATFEEAWNQLEETVNAIEDKHSGVSFDPSRWMKDGRIYPPQLDSERRSDRPNKRRFRTVAHNVFISSDGSIEIEDLRIDAVVFEKGGSTR